MVFKEVLEQLNVHAQCKKYGLSLWQCPQFLFLVMGIIIIISTLLIYAIGRRYIDNPQMVALVVLSITTILFIIAAIITRSFERLAEASRMKSEFVSIVSHQLRSPISNLKWTIEFLMSGRISSVTGKQLEYLKILKENSDRMGELVSDLLTVSRIEQGKLPLKKRKIYFEELVSEAIRGLEIFARASNVEIKFTPEKNLPQIFSDPSQLKLIVGNLLDNAIRYIPGKKPGVKRKNRVTITLKQENNNLRFEVKDTGVGIPESDQKYVFQKFFRSSNVMRHQTEGSGLGLYIVKSIIKKLGGKINFSSQEGIGSTFWFTLPILK